MAIGGTPSGSSVKGPASASPMPDPTTATCGDQLHVPTNRTGILLFDLASDPIESKNLADDPSKAGVIAALSRLLDSYIATAVTPLNILPAERVVDVRAETAAKAAQCWVPWLD